MDTYNYLYLYMYPLLNKDHANCKFEMDKSEKLEHLLVYILLHDPLAYTPTKSTNAVIIPSSLVRSSNLPRNGGTC